LNETLHELEVREESLALDWIRDEAGLKGTKEGCREGDCGACLVLLGGRGPDGEVQWRSVTSCTLAMGELDGRHLVTIEGLASAGLTPVMEAMVDEGASQCGFCSPGFVLALTGYLVTGARIDPVEAMVAIEGNLCRCTGYGSIRRAAAILSRDFADLPAALEPRLRALSARGVIPAGLAALMADPPAPARAKEAPRPGTDSSQSAGLVLGGGTDWFVRNPDPEPGTNAVFMYRSPAARSISRVDRGGEPYIELGAAVSETDFFASPLVRQAAPGIERFEADVASPPIRNRATLAGNIANASPIADMTAMLIALGAEVTVATGQSGGPGGQGPSGERTIAIEDFFFAYKKIDLRSGETITKVTFPSGWTAFAFEKAAKRERLDIATVNCAVAVRMATDGTIFQARYAAGGVAAVPLRLKDVETAMTGRKPSAALVREVGSLASAAGTPMSDVRGSSAYRVRLLERLAWAACIRLWPELGLAEELLA
jgi:xanthine dehydrogenase small subunit